MPEQDPSENLVPSSIDDAQPAPADRDGDGVPSPNPLPGTGDPEPGDDVDAVTPGEGKGGAPQETPGVPNVRTRPESSDGEPAESGPGSSVRTHLGGDVDGDPQTHTTVR